MQVNYQNHIALTACQAIADIMLPQLIQHGIKVMNYYRIYFDGQVVRLSTDSAWTEHYFEKNYLNNLTVPDSYLTKKTNYYIWLTEDCTEMLLDAALNFDTSNGISIAKINANSIEYFCFASTLKNTRIINEFYLNNIDKLEKYCAYFKDTAKDIILQHEKNKIILPNHNGFQIYPQNYFLNQIDSIKLPKSQHACANLLVQGLQYKEIAKKLNISPRTVETHINCLKKKFQCRNKAELIIKLVNNPTLEYFL